MGLLTSRSFTPNCRTKQHIGNKDSVHGMCCILPFGNFIEADVCFPSLGLDHVPLGTFVSLVRTFCHATSQHILGIHLILSASMQQVVVDFIRV